MLFEVHFLVNICLLEFCVRHETTSRLQTASQKGVNADLFQI